MAGNLLSNEATTVLNQEMAAVLKQVYPDNNNPVIPCCVVIATAKAHGNGATSLLYASKLDGDGDIYEGDPIRLSTRNGRYIWRNDDLTKEKIRVGSVVKYVKFGDQNIYHGNTELKRKTVDQMQMGLEYGVSAYRSIKEACPDAILGASKGMYLSSPQENPRIFLVSLAYGVIHNERIKFATKGRGEFVDLKLNCRENLTLSTSPAVLQLRSVSDEDDVGDVAVVKFDTADIGLRSPMCAAVCEGLILRYKPHVISTDEEIVKIKNGEGKYLIFPGIVKFDTGNEVASGISYEFIEKLDLEVDHSKKVRMTTAGRTEDGNEIVAQCSRVNFKLKIRGQVIPVHGLAGAPAPGTDLLIGMDVIKKLHDENFTLGN